VRRIRVSSRVTLGTRALIRFLGTCICLKHRCTCGSLSARWVPS